MKKYFSSKANGENVKLRAAARQGQSVVELMMAIGMLTFGLLGLIGLLAQSLYIDKVDSNSTIGVYLAEEGIEITKNLIDHAVYAYLQNPPQGLGWGSCEDGSSWESCFGASGGDFEVDYTTVGSPNIYVPDHHLKFDPVTGLYSYNPSPADKPVATSYVREVKVTPIFLAGSDYEGFEVQSIVTWGSQSVALEDEFYNWHP
jgi:hypothetical protein